MADLGEQRRLCSTVTASLVLLGLLLPPLGAARAATAEPTIIRNVRLFDGERIIESTDVLFAAGTIRAVAPQLEAPAGSTEVDGSGKTLLPGLIDGHTHTWGTALSQALAFGVTTQIDMFTEHEFATQMRAEQAAGEVSDRADLVSAGTLVTAPGGHGTQFGIDIPTIERADQAEAFVAARIAEGSDFIKLVLEDGQASGRSIPSVDPATAAAVITAARAHGKTAVVHVSTFAAASLAIGAGADGLVHLYYQAGDIATAAEAKLIAHMATRGAFLMPTVTILASALGLSPGRQLATDEQLVPHLSPDQRNALQASFPSRTTEEMKQQRLRDLRRRIAAFERAGVPILAGTDAPNPGTSYGASLHQELSELVEAGLSPLSALAAATSRPADAFGLADRGRVRAGLRADLLLVEGDPTTNIFATRAIVRIWKAGVVFERPKYEQSAPNPVRPTGVVSDFDAAATEASYGSWSLSTDQMAGGKSEAALRFVQPGANGSAAALRVEGEMREGFAFPWAGPMLMASEAPMQPVDLSSAAAIAFWARGQGNLRLLVFDSSFGMVPRDRQITLGSEWQRFEVPFSDYGIDGSALIAVLFSGSGTGPFSFELDEVEFE